MIRLLLGAFLIFWHFSASGLMVMAQTDTHLHLQPQPKPKSAKSAPMAVVRILDRTSGELSDFDISRGQTHVFKILEITLFDCRYPIGAINRDAFASLEIHDTREDRIAFAGWMVASSPALNSLDHPRYDVWVLRCKTS